MLKLMGRRKVIQEVNIFLYYIFQVILNSRKHFCEKINKQFKWRWSRNLFFYAMDMSYFVILAN